MCMQVDNGQWFVTAVVQTTAFPGLAEVASPFAVVEAFAASGDPKEAEAWLRRAAEAGATPNVVTFSSVAKGYTPASNTYDTTPAAHISAAGL